MTNIRACCKNEAKVLVKFSRLLLTELSGRERIVEVSESDIEDWLCRSNYHAFLAFHEGEPVGAITLFESYSIYAGGKFGTIQELYVVPDKRSSGVGRDLVKHAKRYALSSGWRQLEVCVPGSDLWFRSRSFYNREMFIEVGPRMKFVLVDKVSLGGVDE